MVSSVTKLSSARGGHFFLVPLASELTDSGLLVNSGKNRVSRSDMGTYSESMLKEYPENNIASEPISNLINDDLAILVNLTHLL